MLRLTEVFCRFIEYRKDDRGMLRLTGIFVLIFSCVGAGLWFERRERQRIRQLTELLRSMEYLKGEINFARTTLPEAMEAMGKRMQAPFQELFCRMAGEMRQRPGTGFGEIWRAVLDEESAKWDLLPEDVENLYQACCNLGYLDKEMQVHILDRYKKELEKTLEGLSGELPQKTKLYRSLGILSGVFLAILLL